jgi:hypothetical protein
MAFVVGGGKGWRSSKSVEYAAQHKDEIALRKVGVRKEEGQKHTGMGTNAFSS